RGHPAGLGVKPRPGPGLQGGSPPRTRQGPGRLPLRPRRQGRLRGRQAARGTDLNNRIDSLFARLKNDQRRALMPFVTAGDPDLATTALLISELIQRGADLIEVGIPYSDPIADGPVIAASYHRALERGVRVAHILQTLRTLRAEGSKELNATPLVSMVSY